MKDTKARVDSSMFNSVFKFTFARNPWDRMYSSYQFICNKPLSRIENIPQDYYKSIGFKRWLMEEKFFVPNNIPPTPSMIPIQIKNLVDWIYDGDTCLVDYIGRFENINEDFNHILTQIGLPKLPLPHTAKSNRKTDYREAYDSEMVDFISEQHKRDIEYFGYTFE